MRGLGLLVIGSLVVLGATASRAGESAAAFREHPELRLVGLMHENLAAVNRILEAIAREDFAKISPEARHLQTNVRRTRELPLGEIGVASEQNSRFDTYLMAQDRIAGRLAEAGQAKDAAGVLVAIRSLFDEACVACHAEFRSGRELREPTVLLMRDFLKNINRMYEGVALEDFALVAREARQIEAMANVFAWSQVSEALFRIKDPKEQAEFRQHMERLSATALRVEGAAVSRASSQITESMHRMLREGCISCHRQFRKED